MKKLFLLAHKRFVKRHLGEANTLDFKQIIKNLNISNFTDQIYHRLPRQQFKAMLKIPCPTYDPKLEDELVQASKRLRAHNKIAQEKVCNQCKHKTVCPYDKLPVLNEVGSAVEDLVRWFQGYSLQQQQIYRVDVSAYKTLDAFGEVVEDLKNGGTQFFLFDAERLKASAEREQKLLKQKEKTENIKKAAKQKPKRRNPQQKKEEKPAKKKYIDDEDQWQVQQKKNQKNSKQKQGKEKEQNFIKRESKIKEKPKQKSISQQISNKGKHSEKPQQKSNEKKQKANISEQIKKPKIQKPAQETHRSTDYIKQQKNIPKEFAKKLADFDKKSKDVDWKAVQQEVNSPQSERKGRRVNRRKI